MFSPKKAVILAAGFGNRMRPLTDNCPKPLIKVGGVAMIDWIIDALKNVGVTDIIVNTHYLADKILLHLAERSDVNIQISYEENILDTGAGVKNILHLLGNEPFYVINGDVVWQDFDSHISALNGLSQMWNPELMELLLMIYPKNKLSNNTLSGDYIINKTGQLEYQHGGAYIFTGPRIVTPSLFDNSPDDAFSFKLLFDKAEESKKLYGYVHEGAWYHVGTPEELEYVNRSFQTIKKAKAS